MRRTTLLLLLGLVVLVGVAVAQAETPADMLEKGIYTEETVGDLDAAMKIYQKIVDDGKANRPAVAKAQYRLGMCLLKKGKKKEAKKTFEDLVKRFPDQKELVAKAKKQFETSLKLIPAPWKDGEVCQLVLKGAGGMRLGNYIYEAKKVQYQGKQAWQLEYWQRICGMGPSGVSRVQAEVNSLRPLHSLVDNTVFGRISADYTPTEVKIHSIAQGKQSTKTVPLDQVVYDNEEGYYVFRCMPLAVGDKFDVPIFVTMTSQQIGLPVTVAAKEKVKVAAGEFECYRLDLGLVNQTFWISTDENRYLVKFEAGAVYAELAAVNPKDINQFADKSWGFSIEAPRGWFVFESVDTKPGELLVDIIDPSSSAFMLLIVDKLKKTESGKPLTAREAAEKNLPKLAQRIKGFKVRPDSWTERTVGGRPAVSFLGDCTVGGRKKVGYMTCVLGEKTRAGVFVQVDPKDLDAARKQIDPVIDTIKLK